MANSVHPPAMWAQAYDKIYLTYNVECGDPKITFTQQTVSFEGTCEPDNVPYKGTINLYADVEPEKCHFENKGRIIEVTLNKLVANNIFWPRLTSEKVKHHWLRVNFSKIQEENDSDEEGGMPQDGNKRSLEDMMREMGGLDDMKDKPGFDDAETDSDDEPIPDLEG